MVEQRFKNQEWALGNSRGRIGNWDKVQVAVLMDIRDELQEIKALLAPRPPRRAPKRRAQSRKS
jgi:hypothetical protein